MLPSDIQQNSKGFFFWGEHKVLLELEYDIDENYQQRALEELHESPETVEESFKSLRELLEGEPDLELPKDELFLTRFLRCCKWNANYTFEKIKLYYGLQADYPQYFQNVTPENEKKSFKNAQCRPLPYRNPDGSRILLLEASSRWNVKELGLSDALRGVSLAMNALSYEPLTQVAGMHLIFDFHDMPLSVATHLTPTYACALVKFLQDGVPIRFKGIHFVRQSMLFKLVWSLAKPFIGPKFMKLIHFHGNNFKSLHKFVHPSVLPKEFGGELELSLNAPVGDTIYNYLHLYEQSFVEAAKYGWKKNSYKAKKK